MPTNHSSPAPEASSTSLIAIARSIYEQRHSLWQKAINKSSEKSDLALVMRHFYYEINEAIAEVNFKCSFKELVENEECRKILVKSERLRRLVMAVLNFKTQTKDILPPEIKTLLDRAKAEGAGLLTRLDINPNLPLDEIKVTAKGIIRKEHPDKNPEGDKDRFENAVDLLHLINDGLFAQYREELDKIRQAKVTKKKQVQQPKNESPSDKEQLLLRDTQPTLAEQDRSEDDNALKDLISNKLIPMTSGYLNHLIYEAQKINPEINPKKSYESLPLCSGKESDSYNKLCSKYEATKELHKILSDTSNNQSPKARVETFTKKLSEYNDALKEHRDPFWKRFCKNCMVAIGIVCSGIIPGIAALLIYSRVKEKSSPLFFTNSEGKEFVDKVDAELKRKP